MWCIVVLKRARQKTQILILISKQGIFMPDTNAATDKKSRLMLKLLLPAALIAIIVAIVYWGLEVIRDPNKTTHQMAEGVAKFYSTFRESFTPGATQLDEYTLQLPPETESVSQKLEARRLSVEPGNPNWRGKEKRRSFKENETLKTALQAFGEDEDVSVIWDLKYDYIIKNHFVERVNFKELVERISKTIGNDYDGKIQGYFCPTERAIIITDNPDEYVTQSCQLTISKRRIALDKKREEDYKRRLKLGLN
jgi:hypothetical protein